MITMNLDLINPYTLKILISARKEDSINSISNRINLSYGWTYKWIQELAKIGVFKLNRMNIVLNEKNEFYKKTLNYIQNILKNDVNFYYNALQLFGIRYCFTKTDAVFIWTKGGYNIARYKKFYPIFIKINKKDKEIFKYYYKKLNIKNKRVFYYIFYLDKFDISYCDEIPVDSLEYTIKFMQKYIYNFQPALEMIKEMYGKAIKVKYKEVSTNV